MRKLFIDLNNMLVWIKNGKVWPKDLEDGLFFFYTAQIPEHPTSREFIFNKNFFGYDCIDVMVERIFRDDPNEEAVAKKVREAILKAEAEGRAVWRQWDDVSWNPINKLLQTNGFQPISEEGHYNGPTVKEKIRYLIVV